MAEQTPISVDSEIWTSFEKYCEASGVNPLERLSALILNDVNVGAPQDEPLAGERSPVSDLGGDESPEVQLAADETQKGYWDGEQPQDGQLAAEPAHGGQESDYSKGFLDNGIRQESIQEESNAESISPLKVFDNGHQENDEVAQHAEAYPEGVSARPEGWQENQDLPVGSQIGQRDEPKFEIYSEEKSMQDDIPILPVVRGEDEARGDERKRQISPVHAPGVPLTGILLTSLTNDPKMLRSSAKVPTIDQLMMRRRNK